MADNVTIPATGSGTATPVVATDDVGGVHFQKVKLDVGGDGVAGGGPAVGAGAVGATVLRHTLASDDPAVAALQIIDDWDESDRAKVNVVVGQAGITAGAGAVAANTPRVTHASDDPVTTALQLIDDAVFTDDAAFTIGTSKVMMAGFTVDESSTDSADEGDAGAARMTANRQVVVTPRPNANGEGLDIFRSLDLDETEEDVKASAGKLYGWYIYNDGAAEVYVKLYNAADAAVTVGSTTPVMTIPIPAGSGSNVEFSHGIPFSTAICAAATTGVADADTGAPAANQVVANFFYK